MRVLFACVLGAASLGGCEMPRPLLQSTYDRCPHIAATAPPADAVLFITMRQPDCSQGGSVTRLTDLRAREPHYVALSHKTFTFHERDAWLSALARQIGNHSPVVLFIHGYRVENAQALDDAARVQAAVRAPVVALTWPSYGKYTFYLWDETNAEWASDASASAIASIASAFPHVVIIAHSMGNHLALAGLDALLRQPQMAHVDHLIMASPDVDRAALRQSLQDGVGVVVTIYGSRKDQALTSSWRVHSYPRGGDLSWWVNGRDRDYSYAWLRKVEVIDTTDVDHSLIGHSSYLEARAGAEDLCRVVHGAASDRPGIEPLVAKVPHAPDNYFRLVGTSQVDECTQGVR